MKKLLIYPVKSLLFNGVTLGLAGTIALNCNAQVTFQKTFGGTSSEIGYSVQQTTDGGYIVTGFTPNIGAGSNDVLLVKTNASGDTLWTKTYGGTDGDYGESVQQTTDGGYIVTGYTYSFGVAIYELYLIKTDANGDTLWTKTYRAMNETDGKSVQQTSDGGYIIAGSESSLGNKNVYLLKTNAAGDILWSKTYDGGNNDYGESVQQTTDGGYIVLGYTNSFGAGNNDIYLIKTNATGDTLWTKVYGWPLGIANDQGFSVQQTADGGYILCGKIITDLTITSSLYLSKISSIGIVQWAKRYYGTSNIMGYEVRQTTGGGYIVAGEYGVSPTASYAFLMRTDASGDTLWSKGFGGTNFDYAHSVQQTTDGGFIVAGNTTSFSSGNGLYLIKTDANGISGTCHQFAAAPSVNDVTGTIVTGSTVTNVGSGAIVSNTATIVNSGMVVKDLLISTSITITDASCNGGTDGKAVVTVSGGVPSYTYMWSTGQSAVTALSDSIIAPAGTYTLEIIDTYGCYAYDTITINEPPALTVSVVVTNVLCYGDSTGSIDLTVSGGTPPYTYLWTPTADTTQDISGLAATVNGSVEVRDANGCQKIQTYTITEPSALLSTAVTTVSATSCGSADGSASVTVAGGTSPYTYLWQSGGTNATDTALAAGDYTVTVTDTNGCTKTDSATIDIVVPIQPICLITVDTTSTKNVIVWEKPITANIDSFRVYRELGTDDYKHVASISYSSLSVYVDPNVNPNATSYRYKMSVIDICGNQSDTSELHKTIYLSIDVDINGNPKLDWTDYVGFPVSAYNILRDSTGLYQWEIIGTVGFGITNYTDLNPVNNGRYLVEVVSPDTCTATQKAENYNSSKSNTSTSVTGINEFDVGSLEFMVYPNPSRGVFTVEINDLRFMNYDLWIYDVLGREIHKSKIANQKSQIINQKSEIDLFGQPAGIYHLQVITDKGIGNKKVVIAR